MYAADVVYGCHSDYDVALVVLNATTHRQPVELAENADCFESDEGCLIKALGWGHTGYYYGDLAENLQLVSLPSIRRKTCRKFILLYPLTDRMLCAGDMDIHANLFGSCPGDDGGPAFIFDDGALKQVAVLSWGIGCDDIIRPEAMMSVPKVLNWITDQLSNIS